MEALIKKMRWTEGRDLLNKRGKSTSAKTPQEFFEKVAVAIDEMPWFGEPPYQPTLKKKPPRGATEDLPYVRRVLISWLIGRPVSEIATRAGSRSRLVHKIVNRAIYDPDEPILGFWRDLGLVGVIDVPRARFSQRAWDGCSSYGSPVLEPWHPMVVCQVCHRPAGHVEYDGEFRAFDNRLIEPEDRMWEGFVWAEVPETKGHLICHFFLEDDPIFARPLTAADLLVELVGSPETVAHVRRKRALHKRVHWSRRAGWKTKDVVDAWHAQGRPELCPIRDGAEMRRTVAEMHWLGLLRGE